MPERARREAIRRSAIAEKTGVLSAVYFEIAGDIREIEVIATGGRIRDIMRIRKLYGAGRWRKLKGVATVRLESGKRCQAVVHWYEAHGVGRRKMKIKRILD